MKPKDFRKFAENEMIGVDKVVRHRDGTFSLKKGYFYRHGMTSDEWADNVAEALAEEGVSFNIVDSHDDWNSWPKDSWFVCRIQLI